MRAEEHKEMAERLLVDGEWGALLRYDWSQTPLGALETWPDDLKTAVQRRLSELAQVTSAPKTPGEFDWSQNGARDNQVKSVAENCSGREYRTLFESIKEGVRRIELVYDEAFEPVEHRIFQANPAFETHTGLTNVTGRLASELMPEVEQFWKELYARVVATGEVERLEQYSSTFERWFNVEVSRVTDASVRRVAVMFQDITERKLADASRSQSEEGYCTLFESIAQGLCVIEMLFDENSKPCDYCFLKTNPAFEKQTGLVNVEGKRMRELAPNHEEYWFEIYGNIALTGESKRFENRAAALHCWYDVYAFRIGQPEERKVAVLFSDITERKQVEESLRLSEQRLKLALKTGKLGDWQLDLKTLELFTSAQCKANYGFSPEFNFTHSVLSNRIHPDDQTWVQDAIRQSIAQRSDYDVEYRTIWGDGSVHWVMMRGSTVYDTDGTPLWMVGMSLDITERKAAEQAAAADLTDMQRLHDLSTRLIFEDDTQVLFNEILATAIAILKADAGTIQLLEPQTNELVMLATQGIQLEMAQYFARIGASSVTSCGIALNTGVRTCINFAPPGINDPGDCLKMQVDAGLLSAQSTLLITRSGRVLGMLSTYWREHRRPTERELRFLDLLMRQAADLIERRQTEAVLRDTEELKQSILASSKDCIKLLTLNSDIVYINQGGLYLFEVDEATLILNTCWLDFWQGEDHENAKTALAAAKAGNTGQFQAYLPTRKGTPKWWDVIVTPVRNSAGEVTQLLTVSRDITKQKQAETERERLLAQEQAAREQAEIANRVKDEFLAVLSHELRSPLNPILGWTQLLQNGKLDAARQSAALAIIERNAKLQTQLIEDLLDISGIMQGKLSLTSAPVSLTFVISAAVETVQLAAAAKNIELTLDLEPEIAPVSGDAARLQQVVWNLLSNAVKFTPSDGQVTVKLRQLNQLAQIRVSDTGKGIKAQFLPHVFEYFRQEDGSTTRKFGGLGLGLAIARQIVEMHGGTVWAESQGENQGATFVVQLPTTQQMTLTASGSIQTQTELEAPLAGLQILLVDDEPDTREFQAFVLEQSGATVTAVASGLEALQALEQFIPDLLVSDIGMAEMDGYMLLQQVRSHEARLRDSCPRGGTIPAIALTAYAAEFDQQRALRVGFQTHLTKPVEPKELVRTIAILLKHN